MAKQPLTTIFPVTHTTALDPAFFGGLIREVEARIASLEILREGLEAAIRVAQDTAIARVDDIIGPAQAELAAKLEQADTALASSEALLGQLENQQFEVGQINGLQAALDASSAAIAAASKFALKSAPYTASAGERVAADVSEGAWQLDLPAAPDGGDTVVVSVISGDPSSAPLTVNGNGATIEGDATLTVDVARAAVHLIFNGTEWRIG